MFNRLRQSSVRPPFMASLALAALAWAFAPTDAPAADAARPNFVFVFTDDQRWDAMGVVQREQGDQARFPWFQTPHMDRLAAEGVRFRNAFVVNSLCSPSRAAFLTGRYNHHNGIVNNHTPLPEDTVTFATLLREAGYRTGYFGKWHMDGQRGSRPGFDHSASFVGQGRYFDCPVEINGRVTPTTGWVDDVTTGFAIEFLKENRDRPFLMMLGFKSPHGPRQPPPRLAETFAGMQARPAPNAAHEPPYRGNTEYAPRRAANAPNRPNPRRAQQQARAQRPAADLGSEALLNYFRLVAAADENLGRVLDALDELRLAENTVVIFTSDNGYYLGEHGLGDKRSAYDESLRIPLLVRWPRLGEHARGRTEDALVLNIDLAPTLLDLAGASVPESVQGRSWRPLLAGEVGETGETVPWRTAFFYEYFYERNFGVPTVLAVRTESAKLIKYPGHDDWTELFDLATDPWETRNLARDPAHADLLRKLQAEFERQAQTVGFRVPDNADPPPGRTAEERSN